LEPVVANVPFRFVCEEVKEFRLVTDVSNEAVVASRLVSLPSVEDVYELKEAESNFVFIWFSNEPVAAASSASVTYPVSNDEEKLNSCSILAVADVLNEFCEAVRELSAPTDVLSEAVVLFRFAMLTAAD
jgi:hypothetical protein